jgi:hypothetical protein
MRSQILFGDKMPSISFWTALTEEASRNRKSKSLSKAFFPKHKMRKYLHLHLNLQFLRAGLYQPNG